MSQPFSRMEKKVVNIGGKQYVLKVGEFDEELEIEDLLKIDYSNLVGELVTFPIIENRVGLMLADAESKVAEVKLNRDILEAKLKEKYSLLLSDGGKRPTIDAINAAVLQDKGYQAILRSKIAAEKARDYANSLLWSCKSKSSKLEKLSLTIQNQDVPPEILEGRVNGIVIKRGKRVID